MVSSADGGAAASGAASKGASLGSLTSSLGVSLASSFAGASFAGAASVEVTSVASVAGASASSLLSFSGVAVVAAGCDLVGVYLKHEKTKEKSEVRPTKSKYAHPAHASCVGHAWASRQAKTHGTQTTS